ncbi:hypothetical protein SAMN06297251_12737 [Fulvimarina manganoxydans]|uniref:Uncharacterized protein n=1 Tax=Fulvimarina manganoxydans TaxID=937218 RepID=A0A1W2EK41_9HYPH|nr:hypothetical protein [Fulvimarina manganoxydans]SMD10111.1 hypothetical protein SAMN06297251_12737 [Fulvimarina manganoxydans]
MKTVREGVGRYAEIAGRSASIEAWLAWAFREELPKAGSGKVAGFGSGWSMFDNLAKLGVEIDHMNGFWCTIDHSAECDPHPHAVIIGQAVKRMADVSFEAPDGYDLLADIRLSHGSALTDEEREDAMARGIAMARLGENRVPGALIRLAMLGTVPDFAAEERYVRRDVTGPNGKPRWFRRVLRQDGEGRPTHEVEIDGYDRIKGRPYRGAYRKTVVAPDLAILVADRADYQAWVLSLNVLAAEVGAAIGEEIGRSDRPLWPWESGIAGETFEAENPGNARLRSPEGEGEAKLSTRAA